jgi:cholestenol Delta-isomerase
LEIAETSTSRPREILHIPTPIAGRMADHLIPPAASLASNLTTMSLPAHPYYPLDATIDSYAANEWSVPALLSVFFGACTLLFTGTYFLAKRITASLKPPVTLTTGELLTIMWFVLSGSIHIFFEGYYAFNYATLGGKQTLIGQMWKEYAFSDSRYLTKNSFVLCMETVTAVCWGPGCFIVAALIMLRHPGRFPVQMVVSMGQFYGDALYYATSAFDHYVMGVTYSRPEAFYFWFYFVLMNFFWIVIPGCKLKLTALYFSKE